MNIDIKKIEKLKVVKVFSNSILVENLENTRGIVYISEIAKSYIISINDLYKVNDVVYGYLIKKDNDKVFYSLKSGHTSDSKFVNESGGGCLMLLKYVGGDPR